MSIGFDSPFTIGITMPIYSQKRVDVRVTLRLMKR